LALQSDKILLLDHQTDVFIWIGTQCSDSQNKLSICMKYAVEGIKHRFPNPQILVFKESSSMARWLQCRLIPSHKDSPEEQVESFPQLTQIPLQLKKFHKTDDLSFRQYCRQLFSLK